MRFIKIIMVLCVFLSLTSCASPKSEIRNIQFHSFNKQLYDNREKIVIYELLEPMKSYCNFYYDTTNFIAEETTKSNEKFFNYGTCFFNVKDWKNITNLTFRYTTIPNRKDMVVCEFEYDDSVDMENCTKLDDYVSNIYHSIPQDAWETYTINTQEILKNSIKDKDPLGERPSYFRSNWQRVGKERDRYAELQFYPAVDPKVMFDQDKILKCIPPAECITYRADGKTSERLDIGNYWKYQRNTSWN